MQSPLFRVFSAAFVLTSLFIVSPVRAQNSNNYTFTTKVYPERHTTGLVLSKSHEKFLQESLRQTFTATATSIPSQYSMRGQAGPVENQGQCGTCWDFALTTVLRGTWMMSGKDPGRLSFNYLLNCDHSMNGCNGGDFSAAQMFISPYSGAPAYGSDGPYIQQQSTCVQETGIAQATAYHMLGTNGKNPSFQDIAYVVGVLHRPVAVDIAVDSQGLFESYHSGIYNGCNAESPSQLNHMVSIEGYSCETSVDANGNCVFDGFGNLPAGTGYWIIRNS